MIEKIHYVSDNHNNYPHACCGVTGMRASKTKVAEEVTCMKCLKLVEELKEPFFCKREKYLRNQRNRRRSKYAV